LSQPLDLGARVRHFPERGLARLGVGLGRAVEERRPDAGGEQAVDGGVVVFGRRVVVAPVGQRRRAAVELVERADAGGDGQVLRAERRGQAGVHLLEVLQQRPVGGHAAQRGLPGVHVRVDQAGDDDAAGGVDQLRVVGGDAGRDGGDAVGLHQDVGARQVALAGPW
jgi:hypothetical protein